MRASPSTLSLLLGLLATSVCAQQSQEIFTPAWLPLAVRSPHLNTWLWNSTDSVNHWPRFGLDADKLLGWTQFAKVDDELYGFFGNVTTGNWSVTNSRLTPTRTIITVQLGGAVQVTTSFLSPIEPDDLVLQSMPFAYMSSKVSSLDGRSHEVALYSDVTGEWVSSVISSIITWDTNQAATFTYHRIQRQEPLPFAENAGVAEDATLYFGLNAPVLAAPVVPHGWDNARAAFAAETNLGNKATTTFRAIQDQWPVVAFAYDLGAVQEESDEVVWAIGLARDEIVRLGEELGGQVRYPHYLTRYNSTGQAFHAFLEDYEAASARADEFDSKIMGAAANRSAEYADLIALGTRQVLAGFEITVSNGTDGAMNSSDVQAFMKDSGNSQHVNPVQVMFAAWPALLYINSSWAGYLLKSTLQHTSSGAYSASFAPQDLGFSYPAASGDLSSPQESLGVEASGSMLIMAYTQAAASGDGSLIYDHYHTLKTWASYLSENALSTNKGQTTAEGQSGLNNSNLALKGILGLQAMAEISRALQEGADGNSDAGDAETYAADAETYTADAADRMAQWRELAVVDGRIALDYGDASSSGLMFSMYADKLLKSGLVPDELYDLQTATYGAQLDAGGRPYGLPYSNTYGDRGRADLLLLTAATASNQTTRDALVRGVWARAANQSLNGCFPYEYDLGTGAMNTGTASPALGAAFSLLALDLEKRAIVLPERRAGSGHAARNKIIGGVVGGVGGVALLVGLAIVFLRQRRRRAHQAGKDVAPTDGQPSGAPSLLPQPYSTTAPSDDVSRKGKHAGPRPTAPPPLPLRERKIRTRAGAATPDAASTGRTDSPPSHPPDALTPPLAGTTVPSRSPDALSRPDALSPPSLVEERPGEGAGDALLLRNELESLRREMEEMRQLRAYEDVPPPEYYSHAQGGSVS